LITFPSEVLVVASFTRLFSSATSSERSNGIANGVATCDGFEQVTGTALIVQQPVSQHKISGGRFGSATIFSVAVTVTVVVFVVSLEASLSLPLLHRKTPHLPHPGVAGPIKTVSVCSDPVRDIIALVSDRGRNPDEVFRSDMSQITPFDWPHVLFVRVDPNAILGEAASISTSFSASACGSIY
jgi:hypothetical protein